MFSYLSSDPISKRRLSPCCTGVPAERKFCEQYNLHLRAWNPTEYLEINPKMLIYRSLHHYLRRNLELLLFLDGRIKRKKEVFLNYMYQLVFKTQCQYKQNFGFDTFS